MPCAASRPPGAEPRARLGERPQPVLARDQVVERPEQQHGVDARVLAGSSRASPTTAVNVPTAAAAATCAGTGSTSVTSWPAAASRGACTPVAPPTSSTRDPGASRAVDQRGGPQQLDPRRPSTARSAGRARRRSR